MKSIISIVLIVVAGIIFFMFTNPRFAGIKVLRAEEATYNEALDRSKELIALRDALLSKYNSISTDDLEKINHVIPDAVDTVRLIIEINAIAARHNLSLLDIAVGDVDRGTTDSRSTPGQLGPESSSYGSVALSFSTLAKYDTFRAFMADLERNLRLIDIKNISFGEASVGTGLTSYGVTFDTYWMK